MVSEMSVYWLGIIFWFISFTVEETTAAHNVWVMFFFQIINGSLGLVSLLVDYMYMPRMRLWYKK